jgi:hypothetical protein
MDPKKMVIIEERIKKERKKKMSEKLNGEEELL